MTVSTKVLLSISDIHTAIVEKSLKAEELAADYLGRIEVEDVAIHSFLTVDRDGALEQARSIDAKVATGETLPVLAGVPIGIKDVLTQEGLPATAGSKILGGYKPPYTATAVRRLADAGAVLLGKLNCDEFAMGSSNENSAYGPV